MKLPEVLIGCCLLLVVGAAIHQAAHHEPASPPVSTAPAEDELTLLIRERCGHDETPCETATRRCYRACDGLGGRMVEMAPTDGAGLRRYNVCVCASPEGVDRYYEDFSRHERVTQVYCQDIE